MNRSAVTGAVSTRRREGRSLLVSVCGLASSLIWAPPALASDGVTIAPPLTFNEVDGELGRQCAAHQFSGVVLVARAGQTVYRYVCGASDFRTGAPVRPNSRFKIFSISKSFTGTLVMVLAGRGSLKLDDPVSSYLRDIPAEWTQVTIKQLLEHTSGIPDLTQQLYDDYMHDPSDGHRGAVAKVLAELTAEQRRLQFPPGSQWKYNNFGYELLARIVESATHRPFETVLREFVFDRAGKTTLEVAKPEIVGGKIVGSAPSPGLVQGYNCTDNGLEPAASNQFVQLGAGAVYASAPDLVMFDRALLSDRVISARMRERNLAEAYPVSEAVKYGFGWMVRSLDGVQYLQHSGGNNGFVSEFARVPSRNLSVVVVSNISCAKVDELRMHLLHAALADVAGGHSRHSYLGATR